MLLLGQLVVDAEEKENLDQERVNLRMLVNECRELLHIKNVFNMDIEKLRNEYVRLHAWMDKLELTYRLEILEDVLNFLKNYKE